MGRKRKRERRWKKAIRRKREREDRIGMNVDIIM